MKKIKVNITLGDGLWKALRLRSIKEGKSASRILEELVFAYLTRLEGDKWKSVEDYFGVSR